jgi:hypothetical protein
MLTIRYFEFEKEQKEKEEKEELRKGNCQQVSYFHKSKTQ